MPKHKQKQKGGGTGYITGLPVNNIEVFTPTSIANLALWIKADPRYIKEETIQSYANKQSYFVKETILEQFKANLTSRVITEIISDTPANPNSLIPLNLESDTHTIFPTLRIVQNELDAINISNYKEPITGKSNRLQLVTSRPIYVEGSASSYTISHGFTISQNTITNQIVITSNYIENPTPDVQADTLSQPALHPNNGIFAADIEPTAELSEILVYARPLTLDESTKIEGYLAYKQNTQYALDAGHPYLPNMLNDPVFQNIASKIKTSTDLLNQQLAHLNVAVIDYANENNTSGELLLEAPKVKADILGSIKVLHDLAAPLSKGYLYARKINKLTLDTIYKVIEDKKWSTFVLNDFIIDTILSSAAQINANTIKLIAKFRLSYTNPFRHVKQLGGAILSTIRISDQTLFTQEQQKSKLFYEQLRTKSSQSISDGDSIYNTLQNNLKDVIKPLVDTIFHQWSDIQTKDGAINTLFNPIQISITSGTWLKSFPQIDTSFTPIQVNGIHTSIKYNDPGLDLIQTYYTYITTQFKQGDYAYIIEEFKELKLLFTKFLSESLNPIFKETYMTYLMKHLERGDSLYKTYIKVYNEINKYLTNINSFITIGKETGYTTSFPERVSNSSHYDSLKNDIYLRKVTPLDACLFGLEYVEVDKDGHLPGTLVIPFYSKFVNYNFVNSNYVKTLPLLDISGTQIKQTYHILEKLEESIYKGLTDQQKIPLYTYTISSLVDIPINHMNAIHCIETPGSVEPILLPGDGLSPNAWCLVYNIGTNPIVVRRPDNSTHMIGPNNGILYMYLSNNGSYGHRLWTKNQLPYDTLLNVPRTNLSMYIDELGTSIYVRETDTGYEPVYTTDGYLVEVIKENDGSTYDIDDVYKSNAYMISSVALEKRGTLIFNSTMKKMVKITSNSYRMIQDVNTGFAIILNGVGAIGVNEFGFVKAIKTPIQYIDTQCKIQGATSDIILQPTGASLVAPYDFENFLTFNNLFRTQLAAPVNNKNVYVTNNLNPIVNPNGVIIETKSTDITMANPIRIADSIAIAHYDSPAKLNLLNIGQERLRFTSLKKYVKSEIDKLKNIGEEIGSFGEEASALTADTKAYFNASLVKLEANNNIFDPSVQSTQVAIDTAKTLIKEIMNDFYTEKEKAYLSIELYKSGIKEINNLKKKTAYWNTEGSTEIDSMIIKIQAEIQTTLKIYGTTSSPDLTQLLQSSIDAQKEFHKTLQTCMNYVLSPPTYISEVHSWYTTIQPDINNLQSLRDDIYESLNVDLPNIIQEYNRQQKYAVVSQAIQDIFKDIQNKWSAIQNKKLLLDTYLQTKIAKLSPEQSLDIQKKVTDIELKISQGDIRFNSLFKQVKIQRATEQLLSIIKGFQPTIDELDKSIQSLLN